MATATIADATTVLFVVDGEHDLARVEAAYLPPNGYDLPYEVLRGVGEERLHQADGVHRFALFRTVADGPLGGFAAMLRHELRHAEQFREYGPGLFELDGHLRAALGLGRIAAERDAYESIPTEYDANRNAAAAHAHEPWADELANLAADERLLA